MDVDIEQLRALMKAMNKHKLDELELHQGEESIVLRRNAPMLAAAPAIAAAAPIAAPEPKKSRSESADVSADQPGELITSPFVGTFYRAPNPTADPFVKEGGTFEQGQAICIDFVHRRCFSRNVFVLLLSLLPRLQKVQIYFLNQIYCCS